MRVSFSRLTICLTGSLVLLELIVGAPGAEAQELMTGKAAVMQVAEEYRQVLAVYQPGGAYEGAFEQMTRQLEALSPEEVAAYEGVFGSIAARARLNLDIVKTVLRQRDIAIHKQRLKSAGFPDAEFKTINLEGLWEEIKAQYENLPELPSLDELADWITDLDFLRGIPDIAFFPEEAVPLYCEGDLDSDGLPDRHPPEATLFMEFGLQVVELIWQVSGRICDQDLGVFGFTGNLSVVCSWADVFYFPMKDLFENILACEAYYDGQELEASYLRLGHIHEDMETHESNLGDHDFDIKELIAELQAIQGEQGDMLETILENQEEIIRLLNTPSGRRDDWNGKKP